MDLLYIFIRKHRKEFKSRVVPHTAVTYMVVLFLVRASELSQVVQCHSCNWGTRTEPRILGEVSSLSYKNLR